MGMSSCGARDGWNRIALRRPRDFRKGIQVSHLVFVPSALDPQSFRSFFPSFVREVHADYAIRVARFVVDPSIFFQGKSKSSLLEQY